jgi:hypothetical protein
LIRPETTDFTSTFVKALRGSAHERTDILAQVSGDCTGLPRARRLLLLSGDAMPAPIAYLAQGRLHFQNGSEPARAWESRFGQTVRDRALEIQQRHSWKEAGRGAQFMGRSLLWAGGAPPAEVQIRISSLTRGNGPEEILYALETSEVCGLFRMQADGEERRLFHGNERRQIQHLCARGDRDRIACAVLGEGGANIALMSRDGSELSEVTEGDSVDLAPSWVPGSSPEIVFQSAGIGRDRQGRPVTYGPSVIQKLDLARGDVSLLHEERGQDLLGPQMAADGSLYFIRRPYRTVGGGSFLRSLLDFVLFPARLLYALFQYLNFFTARYTGRPLTTAGGPERKGADARQMLIWGNLIEAEGAARGGPASEEPPAIVPSSWQLVRRAAGRSEVLASGIVAFDLTAEGGIIYSNGSAVYHRDGAGRTERLCTGDHIEQVVALS